VVALVLVCVGILAYGSYVLHGGFYSDDWSDAADYQLSDSPRYWSSVGYLSGFLGGRPVLILLLPLPDAIFGPHPSLHLALTLGLGVATSLCLYLVLRTLAMARTHAGAIAVLTLLFPWSDAIRLWSVSFLISVSACFFLLGLVLALHGLNRRGRGAVAMHGGAVALYALSVLTYQATAAWVALAGFLYLGRAPLRRVARRWLTDVLVLVSALAYSLAVTVRTRNVASFHQRLADVRTFVREGASLLASALVPVNSSSWLVKGLVLFAAVAVVAAALVRLRRSQGGASRYWISVIGAALVAIAGAYFMFLGSFLHPLDPGTAMRSNAFAGLAYCVLVYGLVATGAQVLAHGRPWAPVATLAVVAVIAVGYGVRLGEDESTWRRASVLQHELLKRVAPNIRQLPRGGTLLTFNYPADVSPGVPIFDRSWDLNGAVRLAAGDRTLTAYPIFQGVSVRCERRRLVVEGPGSYGTLAVRYGGAVFVDVRTGDEERIGTPTVCKRALPRFRPGPLLSG
jgi:hypothetical protein